MTLAKETLIKLITFMVRQAHHERNQYITVRSEPVEGLNQSFLNGLFNQSLTLRDDHEYVPQQAHLILQQPLQAISLINNNQILVWQ